MQIFQNTRRTNEVWSFDSSCLKDELIEEIYEERVDALRLVSESSEMAPIVAFLTKLKKHPRAKERPVPVMVDLVARLRGFIHGLAQPKEVMFGEILTLSLPNGKGDYQVQTTEWGTLFKLDCPVFIGTGSVMLMPKELGDKLAHFEVIQGGTIFPEAEIHVPGTKPKVRFEDIEAADLKAVLSMGIDYLVAPGFEDETDLKKLLKQVEPLGPENAPWVILKISSLGVFHNLDKLLPLVRGVLISRMELAMTTDPANVPMVTKEIIQKCNQSAKLVLVASEMLGSMRHNVTPTRAEVSDIANAVMDGADAVVLSEDLPYGKFARRGLGLARKIIQEIETNESQHNLNWIKDRPEVDDELAAVTFTAYRAAIRNNAKAIVCITKTGNTALHLSSFRAHIPIIAITLNPGVVRRLSLVRGVVGYTINHPLNIDQVLPVINDTLTRESGLKAGDKIIFVSVTISSIGSEASNLFTIQTLV